MKYLKRSPEK